MKSISWKKKVYYFEAGPIQVEDSQELSCHLVEEKRTFTVDPGCTSTMVRTADILQGMKKATRKVKLDSSGSEIPVNGTGSFQLPLSSGKIQNIPGASEERFVVCSADHRCWNEGRFYASSVYFYSGVTKIKGSFIAAGTGQGNLFELEFPVDVDEKALTTEVDKKALLWHRPLGHAG
ncbi:hypothetical protein R1flu_023049 [Riccia fluitans]|uniref:Altered inheritance of mitochondria protein 24, mitochondrial n=1 Tax=Riccia fluitans TaxID=41844 RepID=A0ABD1XQY1_9MARC